MSTKVGADHLLTNDLLAQGRYRIDRLAKTDGMGVVYSELLQADCEKEDVTTDPTDSIYSDPTAIQGDVA